MRLRTGAETLVKPQIVEEMLSKIDPLVAQPLQLDDAEVAQILAFLDAMTDPSAVDMSRVVPDSVPSGLPVSDALPGPTAFTHVSEAAGITVNRDATGARVIVTTADGRIQMQDMHNGSSVGGGSALELLFGLGESTPQTVEIHWPDGTRQTLGDLEANRAYEISYGGDVVE